ncbi:MAG: hypothetical protein NPINA01_27660 [Nitrospinaceae bacterium]|nr:MAG: hypothetical protein NPINA01_27660 [Nitrospinaceae bacterium]
MDRSGGRREGGSGSKEGDFHKEDAFDWKIYWDYLHEAWHQKKLHEIN